MVAPPPPTDRIPPEIPAGTLEALQDERAVRSLRHYIPLVWAALMTGTPLVRGWYLDAIADHLDALKRFLLGQPGGLQRLAIAGPARSIKSTAPRPRLALWHRTTSQSHWAFTKLRRTA